MLILYVLTRTKQGLDLSDELARAKRLLDEKYFEAGRLREESVAKGDSNNGARAQLQDLEREIEGVKAHRAELFRELSNFRSMNDSRTVEAAQQAEKLKQVEAELARTNMRCDDTTRLLEARTADLRSKQLALSDTENNLGRTREDNNKLSCENAALRRDNDRVATENYDLRKEVEACEGRNADLSISIRNNEVSLAEKENNISMLRRDIECLRVTQSQNGQQNADLTAEKEALEKHASCLTGQNTDLAGELERMVETDEAVRY